MQGDIVCIDMENRLDYCCYWMGLSMIGGVPALINNNLRQQALHHTITVINCKAAIFSADTMPGTNKCDIVANIKTNLHVADC